MQAHRRGLQEGLAEMEMGTEHTQTLGLISKLVSESDWLKGIQTVLRPPPRVMLVHCSWLLTRASILRLNDDISVIGNSGDHCRRGRIDSILIYGDITHWCGVLTKELRTLRRSARAFVIITLQTFLHHLMSFSKTHIAMKCTFLHTCTQCTRQVKPKCNFCRYALCM